MKRKRAAVGEGGNAPPRRRPAHSRPGGPAGGAAEILERDYGIDAGEVLSMNVDTVETVQSESKVNAADAEEILRSWSATDWGFTRGALSGTINSFSAFEPSGNFDVVNKNGQSRVIAIQEVYNLNTFKDENNYFSNPTKAEYRATFGTDGGSSVHGEAWYWFKLNEANTKGWAVVFDNHTACGPFSNADYALYLVKLEGGTYSVMSGRTATVTNYDQCPEYRLTVKEADGKADINIHCNNSAAYINGGTGDLNWNGIDVGMDDPATQAFGIFGYKGAYFADCSTSVEATVVKSFGDIVYEPTWTEGALHMLINMDGAADRTMLGTDGGVEK